MQSYKDLKAWQKAMELVLEVYRITQDFPRHELYGLTSQLRRAAVSVPSNIAEGKGRYSDREFIQFLRHARGSLLEIETQVLIAEELKYVHHKQTSRVLDLTAETGKIVNSLISAFKD
jgi:four helix bundle protein